MHDLEYERYKDSRGRHRVWVDCSCGWFHAAKNRTHAKKLGVEHQGDKNERPW